MAMNKDERTRRRALAKMLHVHESLSQKEIAARVGVSEVSISKWNKEDNWDSLKASITITKEEQLKNLYRQLAAINRCIAERDGNKYATTQEADTISKLANAINKMESDIGVAEKVAVSKKFLNWVRRFDIEKAQEITPLFDAFIKESLR